MIKIRLSIILWITLLSNLHIKSLLSNLHIKSIKIQSFIIFMISYIFYLHTNAALSLMASLNQWDFYLWILKSNFLKFVVFPTGKNKIIERQKL